jgi:hypothetical protein
VRKGAGNIRLVNDTDNALSQTINVSSAEISIDGMTVTINPDTNLQAGHAYHIEIDAGAFTDLAGNAWAGISGTTAWNFSIGFAGVSISNIAVDNIVNAAENAATITVSGAVSGDAAVRNALVQGNFTVTLTPQGGGTTVTATMTGYDSGTGQWTATVPANTLVTELTYDVKIQVIGTSGAANGLSFDETRTLMVDTTAPTANFGAAADNVGSVTGNLASGDTTDDTSLALSGTCEVGSTVKVYNGAALLGSATVVGTEWSYTATVADGTTYQFNVKETDRAGNESVATDNFTVPRCFKWIKALRPCPDSDNLSRL